MLDLQHDARVLILISRKDFRDVLQLILEHVAILHRFIPLQPPFLILWPVLRPDRVGSPHVDADVLAECEHPGSLLLNEPEVEAFLLFAYPAGQFFSLIVCSVGGHGL